MGTGKKRNSEPHMYIFHNNVTGGFQRKETTGQVFNWKPSWDQFSRVWVTDIVRYWVVLWLHMCGALERDHRNIKLCKNFGEHLRLKDKVWYWGGIIRDKEIKEGTASRLPKRSGWIGISKELRYREKGIPVSQEYVTSQVETEFSHCQGERNASGR